MAARVAVQLDLAKRSVFVQWETALFECRAPDAARVVLGFDRAGRSSKLPSECDVKRDDVRADRLYLDLMLEEVEFVGACAFCDLSSGSWGWCLHCERIYPASKWRDNKWFCLDSDCDGGPADVFPFPSTPGCENCLPPLDHQPAHLMEGQHFPLWPAPSPMRRQLLSNPIVAIQQIVARKRVH